MSVQNKSRALEELRALHNTIAPPQVDLKSPTKSSQKSELTDFSTLPHLQQVLIARSAGDLLGFPNPFFRQIEQVDGTRVQIAGKWVENFSAYDYLSLNQHTRISSAVEKAVSQFGVSATASRLVGGERPLHTALEEGLANFLGTDDALVTVSGHATNLAIIRTLMEPGDLVVVDALAHNSVFEGIRASGATHITFAHNDLEKLSSRLDSIRDQYKRVLIVSEGLYSMDGDLPDLAGLVALKERYEAWLMLDEAHSIGVLGKTGRGCTEEAGIHISKIDIVMGTLSKAFCSCGGFVAGSRALIDNLRYAAPGFVYSVGLSVPNTAAALEALRLIDAEPERVLHLRSLGEHFNKAAIAAGLDIGLGHGFAVAPIIIGDSLRAAWASNALLESGFNVLPIIAPAVPNKGARLRFFLNAGHTEEIIDRAIEQTTKIVDQASTQKF